MCSTRGRESCSVRGGGGAMRDEEKGPYSERESVRRGRGVVLEGEIARGRYGEKVKERCRERGSMEGRK